MTYRTSHNSLKFLNYIKFKNRSGTFLTPCTLFLFLELVTFCHRLLLTLFSICSILSALSSLPPSHDYHFLAPLIPNTQIPLLLALLCPPSSMFHRHFLHLCTDTWSLTYLLSSLFFQTHIFSILVSALLLPWSLCKSQYHLQTLSMVVLSLLCPLAYL